MTAAPTGDMAADRTPARGTRLSDVAATIDQSVRCNRTGMEQGHERANASRAGSARRNPGSWALAAAGIPRAAPSVDAHGDHRMEPD
jgi:hypothetical protein